MRFWRTLRAPFHSDRRGEEVSGLSIFSRWGMSLSPHSTATTRTLMLGFGAVLWSASASHRNDVGSISCYLAKRFVSDNIRPMPDDKRTERFDFRLSETLLRKLEKMAKAARRTVSDYIRIVLEDHAKDQ